MWSSSAEPITPGSTVATSLVSWPWCSSTRYPSAKAQSRGSTALVSQKQGDGNRRWFLLYRKDDAMIRLLAVSANRSERLARDNRNTAHPRGQPETPAKAPEVAAAPVDKTLTKGLQLLEAMAEGEQSRGISELALQLSLTKSNVHRLLQTLSKCGYVTRETGTDRYLLSTKLWRVSRRGRPYDALRRLARPVLRTLVDDTGESVLFCVIENDE